VYEWSLVNYIIVLHIYLFYVGVYTWKCVHILYNNLLIDHFLRDDEGFRQSYPFLVLIYTLTRNNVHGVTIIGPAGAIIITGIYMSICDRVL